MKNNKRAFTIVELVIVIAVIGILAAVLIPTFSSLIEKANMNSDEAAVKSMNTYLSADEQINGKPATWQDAVKVLSKSNLDAQNYRALSSEHQLVWDASVNRVLYVEKKTQLVVYPEEYTADGMLDLGYTYGSWTTLEGKMVADDSWRFNVTTDFSNFVSVNNGEVVYKDATGKEYKDEALDSYISSKQESGEYVDYFGGDKAANLAAMEYKNNAEIKSGMAEFTVGSDKYYISKVNKGEQLVSYVEYVQKDENNDGENFTLVLTDNINLNSTEWKPIGIYQGSIDGAGNSITNFTMTDRTAEVKMYKNSSTNGGNFYYGFISVFEGNYLGNMTFETININNPGLESESCPANFDQTGHIVGVVAGLVHNYDNEKVVIENITVKEGTITGLGRIGGLFGRVGSNSIDKKADGTSGMSGGSIVIKNCTNYANVVSTAKVAHDYSTAGGIAGSVQRVYDGEVVFENCVNYGSVTGQSAGGILSIYNNASYAAKEADFRLQIVNCKNYGTVNGLAHDSIKKSSAEVATSKFSPVYAGGILAQATGADVKVTGCVNEGKVVLTNTYETEEAKTKSVECNYLAYSIAPANCTVNDNTAVDKFEFNVSYAKAVNYLPVGAEAVVEAKGLFFNANQAEVIVK